MGFPDYKNHKAKANLIPIISFSVNFSFFISDKQISLH